MKLITLIVLVLTLEFCAIFAFAKDASPIAVTKNDRGKMGAVDARGETVIPFAYDLLRPLGEDFFVVGRRSSERSRQTLLGVVDRQNRQVLPIKFSNIEYDRDIKRFEVGIKQKGATKFGFLDLTGRTIVPMVYDAVERMAGEPAKLVKKDGKRGYIDVVSGKALIKPEFDALLIDLRHKDVNGHGLAVAAKRNKWGVLSTSGAVIVPFKFDHIGEISPRDKTALAERKGRRVLLAIDGTRYTVSENLPNEYGSNAITTSTTANSRGFAGIGVVLKKKVMSVDEFVRVQDVLAGSPADKAGLRKGDLIFAIDGTDVADLSSADQVRQALESHAGTRVNLIVRRPGDAGRRTVEVERQVLQVSR